jgi:hypothetical protein
MIFGVRTNDTIRDHAALSYGSWFGMVWFGLVWFSDIGLYELS